VSSLVAKRAEERAILLGSALWILMVAAVMLSGVLRYFRDAEYLAFSAACAATVTLLPWWLGRARGPLVQRYLLKVNVYAGILMLVGTFFGTAYFFDLMHMRYSFATELSLQAAHVGKQGGVVPLFMYPLTQAYFVTYYTGLVLLEREFAARLSLRSWGRLGLVVALSYALAFLETFAMATAPMQDLFVYEKKDRMLSLGSVGYSVYFLIGLPLFRGVDDPDPTPLGQVALRALAAGMLVLFALELYSRVVGPL
jgi:cycloeucalenol cycloisomerase